MMDRERPSASDSKEKIPGAWISQNRKMSKDYERLCASGEAFDYADMSLLMTRRSLRL